MIKTLVVTLYSAEAEFEECKSAILCQDECEINHVVFQGLSEIDAHNSLLETFEKEKYNYDLFVKVDADTIIDHKKAFNIVYKKISSTDAAGAQLKLYDFFTCELINGLNFYNPLKNKYIKTLDSLYCDRSIIHLSNILNSDHFENDGIIPVGRHCAYPADRQAFHYGFHRGLKRRIEEYQATILATMLHKDRS
jgi:hypothetical protein